MMRDSLIFIRVRDRHFIRLIIIQDRTIRFIRVRLTITRARGLTTLGTVTAEVMAEDSAEVMAEDSAAVTDIKRRLPKWGQSSSPFFLLKMTIS